MRKLITIGLLLISSLSFAQTWQGGLSNVIQRQPTDTGFNYRISLGSGKGVLNLTSKERIDSLFTSSALPLGLRGQQLKVSLENKNIYTPQEPLIYGQFVYSASQLTRALSNGEATQQQIFNSFKRYSHGTTPVNPETPVPSNNIPGNPSQTNSWAYDTGLNRINSTFNTGSTIGFFSIDKFDRYVHTATVGSTAADNDFIGIVIAFVEDHTDMVVNQAYGLNPSDFTWPIDVTSPLIPNQHALTLYRNRNGATDSYAVYYDKGKLTERRVRDGSSMSGLFTTSANWSGATVDMGVTRSGDSIIVRTSDFSDAPGGKGALRYQMVLNLNSGDADLARFRGKQPYGYSAQSQANAYFSNINFSGSLNVIYDLRNGNTYPFTGLGYVLDNTKNMYTDLGTRFFWRNTNEGSFGYTLPGNTYDVITQSEYDGIPVKSPNGNIYRIIVANNGTLSTVTP